MKIRQFKLTTDVKTMAVFTRNFNTQGNKNREYCLNDVWVDVMYERKTDWKLPECLSCNDSSSKSCSLALHSLFHSVSHPLTSCLNRLTLPLSLLPSLPPSLIKKKWISDFKMTPIDLNENSSLRAWVFLQLAPPCSLLAHRLYIGMTWHKLLLGSQKVLQI